MSLSTWFGGVGLSLARAVGRLAAAAMAVALAGGLVGCKSLASVSAQRRQPRESDPTTIVIGNGVLHTHVKRMGINLSGQTFYDSGQMLRNLTFRNPGFEGETWQSLLHCKTATATSCVDENIYAVWPAGFLDGAHFDVITGADVGGAGTVTSSEAAANNHGFTVHFDIPQAALKPGDFIRVRLRKPGNAEAGWWTDLNGGAQLATEFNDLPPHTEGRQALRIEALEPNQTAAVSSFFDSYNGHSFVQLHGVYTLTFRAKSLGGKPSVEVSLARLDTAHGLHSFLAKAVPLTQAWQQFSVPFTADEDRNAIGTVGLSFTFAGSSALLDDVALTAAAAPGNPTAFRNEVVDTLRTLHPGVLRYMDNGTDFGSSLDNMLAPPFGRERAGSSTQEKRREDIPIGLEEFLVLCKAIGAEPWYTLPAGSSPEEAAALIEFLAGDASTPYGRRRAQLGQPATWTTAFPTIHLELGNEQWNARSFAGSTINDPKAYGRRATQIFTAMRRAPSFQPARFDLILGAWAALPWWTGEELKTGTAQDAVAFAPYLFNEFNDASSTEAIFGPMFAEPEMISSPANGSMTKQLAAVRAGSHGNGLAVYETNLGTMSGSASQADIDRAVPSLGAGLAVADNMLLMLRDLGITTQCLFALPEYINGFAHTGTGANEAVPLWGAVVDMGGATDLRRPTYLAEQLINQAILPTMLSTRIAGTDPTWDQPKSLNDKVELSGAHLLQTFAFSDGPRYSLILINLSRDRALPVQFSGAFQPAGSVEEARMSGPAIDANNERLGQVTILLRTLPHFNPSTEYALPPWSMITLRWVTSGHL